MVVQRLLRWIWGAGTASRAEGRGDRADGAVRAGGGQQRAAEVCFLGSPGELGRVRSSPDLTAAPHLLVSVAPASVSRDTEGPSCGVAPCGHHARVEDVLHGDPFLCSCLSPKSTGSGVTTAHSSHRDLSLCVFQPAALGQRPGLPVPHGRRPRRALQQRRGAAAPPERPPGRAAGRAFQGKAPPLGRPLVCDVDTGLEFTC